MAPATRPLSRPGPWRPSPKGKERGPSGTATAPSVSRECASPWRWRSSYGRSADTIKAAPRQAKINAASMPHYRRSGGGRLPEAAQGEGERPRQERHLSGIDVHLGKRREGLRE